MKIAKPIPPETLPLPETEKGKPRESYKVNGVKYYPLPDSHGFVQLGKASWYGPKFHGRRTASGEVYDMYKKSAAHKTLPLNTTVKVTNLANRKFTIVRINDRGPFVKGREIDLSYSAAKDIDLIGPGVADVKIEALGKEMKQAKSAADLKPKIEVEKFKEGEFTVQIGAFKNKETARNLADRLKVIFDYVEIKAYQNKDNKTLYRIFVSKSETLNKAQVNEKKLEDMGFTGAFIVRI